MGGSHVPTSLALILRLWRVVRPLWEPIPPPQPTASQFRGEGVTHKTGRSQGIRSLSRNSTLSQTPRQGHWS